MIVVLKNNTKREKREQLIDLLKDMGLDIHVSEGKYQTILGLVGDTSSVDIDLIESLDIVDSVKRVSETFKLCNRKFHPDDTVVCLNNRTAFGGGAFTLIAGPCSVESEAQVETIARLLDGRVQHILLLMGGMGRRQLKAERERLASIPETESRVILATGSFLGEGFDDARLDTLFLAQPISWKGRLTQFAGRLHRRHDG